MKEINLIFGLLILVACVENPRTISRMDVLDSCKYNISFNQSQASTIEKKDTLLKIEPDFFELNNEAFEKFKSSKYSNCFLSNDKKTKLYFVTYADYSITTTVLTSQNELPNDVIELFESEGIKTNSNKEGINIGNIVSKKGIKLKMPMQLVIDIYGLPKSRVKKDNEETLYWTFKMKENQNPKVGGLKPFILEDLGFEVQMIFEKSKLVTLIYRYEVP